MRLVGEVTHKTAFYGNIMAAKERLLREIDGDLLSDSHVGEKHELRVQGQHQDSIEHRPAYLLNQLVGFMTLITRTVNWDARLIQSERQAKRFVAKGTILEATSAQLACQVPQNLDIVLDS